MSKGVKSTLSEFNQELRQSQPQQEANSKTTSSNSAPKKSLFAALREANEEIKQDIEVNKPTGPAIVTFATETTSHPKTPTTPNNKKSSFAKSTESIEIVVQPPKITSDMILPGQTIISKLRPYLTDIKRSGDYVTRFLQRRWENRISQNASRQQKYSHNKRDFVPSADIESIIYNMKRDTIFIHYFQDQENAVGYMQQNFVRKVLTELKSLLTCLNCGKNNTLDYTLKETNPFFAENPEHEIEFNLTENIQCMDCRFINAIDSKTFWESKKEPFKPPVQHQQRNYSSKLSKTAKTFVPAEKKVKEVQQKKEEPIVTPKQKEKPKEPEPIDENDFGAIQKHYKAAGVLPYTFIDGKLHILLGKELRKKDKFYTWSEFGGKREKDDRDSIATAAREFTEETISFVGKQVTQDLVQAYEKSVEIISESCKKSKTEGTFAKYLSFGKYHLFVIKLDPIDVSKFSSEGEEDEQGEVPAKEALKWFDVAELQASCFNTANHSMIKGKLHIKLADGGFLYPFFVQTLRAIAPILVGEIK